MSALGDLQLRTSSQDDGLDPFQFTIQYNWVQRNKRWDGIKAHKVELMRGRKAIFEPRRVPQPSNSNQLLSLSPWPTDFAKSTYHRQINFTTLVIGGRKMSLVPPATRDGWSYSGDLHVEASGNNRHRRATVPELKAVYDGTDGAKDRPAHWYEAQLIHYGLPPSKTKGTAKMRLFDAVNKGNLAVPAHILKTEAELKKEWAKRERDAKQALKKLTAPATTPAKRSNKRKADDGQAGMAPGTNVNINLSVSIGPNGNVQMAPAEPAAKKARATPKAKPTPEAKPTPKPKSTPKPKPTPTAKRPATTKPTTAPSTQAAPRTKQTARRGTSSAGVAKAAAPSRSAPDTPSDKPARAPRTKQTARRSRPFNMASQSRPTAATPPQAPQFDATPSQWDSPHDDPPPPYPGSPMHLDGDNYNYNNYNDQEDNPPSPLPPLGLLNGRYHLHCTSPPQHADRGSSADSGVIFTLDGDALWGSFEIGPLSGILRLDERPWTASHRPLYFGWRGEDGQGGEYDEVDDGSYVKFLGDGVVVGRIGFYDGEMLEFRGCRVGGQGTRSEVGVFEMRRQWDERRL